MTSLKKINDFLASVDLPLYRERYSRIKLVELDLPRNIQAIRHLYQEYWDKREDFPTFEKFYQIYSGDLKKELESFRIETMFSQETFYRGLPARIYRTWASLLTQIQGGYVAESIYGRKNVKMSAELDYKGIDDIQIVHNNEILNIQIKKETMSRAVRAPWKINKKQITITTVYYEVPNCDPQTKTGKNSVPFQRWLDKWSGKLERLNNGFIIFQSQMFAHENIIIP